MIGKEVIDSLFDGWKFVTEFHSDVCFVIVTAITGNLECIDVYFVVHVAIIAHVYFYVNTCIVSSVHMVPF